MTIDQKNKVEEQLDQSTERDFAKHMEKVASAIPGLDCYYDSDIAFFDLSIENSYELSDEMTFNIPSLQFSLISATKIELIVSFQKNGLKWEGALFESDNYEDLITYIKKREAMAIRRLAFIEKIDSFLKKKGLKPSNKNQGTTEEYVEYWYDIDDIQDFNKLKDLAREIVVEFGNQIGSFTRKVIAIHEGEEEEQNQTKQESQAGPDLINRVKRLRLSVPGLNIVKEYKETDGILLKLQPPKNNPLPSNYMFRFFIQIDNNGDFAIIFESPCIVTSVIEEHLEDDLDTTESIRNTIGIVRERIRHLERGIGIMRDLAQQLEDDGWENNGLEYHDSDYLSAETWEYRPSQSAEGDQTQYLLDFIKNYYSKFRTEIETVKKRLNRSALSLV